MATRALQLLPPVDVQLSAELIAVADSIPSPILVIDRHRRIHFINRAAAQLLGRPQRSLVGIAVLELVHPGDRRRVARHLGRASSAPGPSERLECRVAASDRGWRTMSVIAAVLPDEVVAGMVLVSAIDVTEQRAQELSLRHLFLHDTVTGLGNRALLEERLRHEIDRPGLLSVVLIGLDDFRRVNGCLGHRVGDEVLRAVAGRIERELPPGGLAVRFGGDRFAVLLVGIEPERATALAWQLLGVLSEPLFCSGHELRLTASAGIASREPASSAESLMRDAETAVTEAKQNRRGGAECFTDALRARAVEQMQLEIDLRHAIDQGELVLHYQPVVSLANGVVSGHEALLRWRRADGTLTAPSDLLPVAERSGLIASLGEWVLETAVTALSNGLMERLTVNLAPRQLAVPGLVAALGRLLERTGVEPSRLALEVTEETLIEDLELGIGVLSDLRRLGCPVGMDDFGSGYSSLNYLRRLPLDYLKLDRGLVETVPADVHATAIAATVVRLAELLGLATIAEGIETKEQAETMTDLGCGYGQGYFFGRPGAL